MAAARALPFLELDTIDDKLMQAAHGATPLARVALPPALRVKVDIVALLAEERQHER